MREPFTLTQRQRLVELNIRAEEMDLTFPDAGSRDQKFKELEAIQILENRAHLKGVLGGDRQSLVHQLEESLSTWLRSSMEYTRVSTPLMISETMLSRMDIGTDHPLRNQIFWLSGNKCLRPMLAPNLYELMRDMYKTLHEPIRIFEVGPCYRKESQGAQHLSEFTMLNMVEFAATDKGKQMERLKEIAIGAMEAVGLTDYQLVIETSEVYGETLDIVKDGVELASGAYGPHRLDVNWGIFDTVWVGMGFGIERIAMVLGGYETIKRLGRSLHYVDGVRLKL